MPRNVWNIDRHVWHVPGPREQCSQPTQQWQDWAGWSPAKRSEALGLHQNLKQTLRNELLEPGITKWKSMRKLAPQLAQSSRPKSGPDIGGLGPNHQKWFESDPESTVWIENWSRSQDRSKAFGPGLSHSKGFPRPQNVLE